MRTMIFDPSTATPDMLAGLAEAEFRIVVDADLRRRIKPDGLPEAVSKALRSPAHLERYHTTLESIAQFTEDQLQILDESFDRQRADASPGQLVELRAEHERRRRATERFRSVVTDYLASAGALLAENRRALVPAGLIAERDAHARRILELERAIKAHRTAVHHDLGAGEEPTPYETALWAMLD